MMPRNHLRGYRASLSLRVGTVSLLAAMALAATAQTETNRRNLQQISSAELTRTTSALTRLRAWSNATGMPMKRTIWNNRLQRNDIIVLRDVRNGRGVYVGTTSTESARSLNVLSLWPGGSLGTNVTGKGTNGRPDFVAGVWEAGGNSDVAHREFQNRVVIRDGNTNTSDHATHVTGIIAAAGITPLAKGLAFESRIDAYDVFNDFGEMANAAANGLQLSNHSYGVRAGWQFGWGGQNAWYWLGDPSVSETKDWTFGYYDSECAQLDQILYNAPYYLPQVSSGNQLNPGVPTTQPFSHYVWINNAWTQVTDKTRDRQVDYDTIAGMQLAKNIVSVGAVEEVPNYNGANSVQLADFSSTGPTDDGRIKPDIVTPGVNTYSSVDGNGYARFSGTSMAAPNATGTFMLLEQIYGNLNFGARMRSATMRALAIHTAREAGANAGPDYQYGWGLVDGDAAARVIQSAAFAPGIIQERALVSGQTLDIPVVVGGDGTSPLKVTIAWTDPAGTPGPRANDNRTPMLVNDLDVRIIRSGNQFQPWTLNPDQPSLAAVAGDNFRDNVEQILINNAAPGQYTIRVSHKGTSLRPSGTQAFSMIATYVQPDGFRDLALTPQTVIGGVESSTAVLSLETAVTSDTTVRLTTSNIRAAKIRNSNANGELDIVIPNGSDRAEFIIDTFATRPLDGSGRTSVTVTAASDRGIRSSTLFVTPVGISTFEVNPASIAGGNTVEAVVTLSSPAPSTGAAVRITSDRSLVARPERNWITIPAGQRVGKLRIRTFSTSSPETVVLTADRQGNKVDTELAVNPPTLLSMAATPANVFFGQQVRLTISLDAPANKGGAVVQITNSAPLAINLPSTVTIPAGKRSVTVVATANRVSDATQVTITGTRLNVDRSVTFTVRP